MNKVAIFGQAYKNNDRQYFEILIENLHKYGIEIVIEEEFVKILSNLGVKNMQFPTFSKHEDLHDNIDMMFTLGGDDTILNAITLVRDLNIPILGVN